MDLSPALQLLAHTHTHTSEKTYSTYVPNQGHRLVCVTASDPVKLVRAMKGHH